MRMRMILAGVVLIALAATAQAQQYTIGNITIEARPNPVTFSSPVRVEGRARGVGNESILLQSSTDRTNWATLQRGVTQRNGRYSFGHRPSRNLYYRAALERTRVASPPLLVRVRMLVGLRVSDRTPSRGERVRFFGIVRPPHNGRRVYLQKRSSSGRFVTIKRGTLRALDAQSSHYSMSVRVRRTGVYRTRVLGHGDHAQGVSRERTLTVG